MQALEWAAAAIAVLFLLGVVGCMFALPSVIWQFVRVLFEKEAASESPEQTPPTG